MIFRWRVSELMEIRQRSAEVCARFDRRTDAPCGVVLDAVIQLT
jgi:hypothetical protein